MLNMIIDNGIHEYDLINDLYIYPKSYRIGAPEPKLSTIDVPYRNGSLDISEALSGIRYNDRQLSIPMLIASKDPMLSYSDFCNLFVGKKCKIRISHDTIVYTDYYYEGRVVVSELLTEGTKWWFRLLMKVYPYQMREKTIEISSPNTMHIYVHGIEVVPTITTDSVITVQINEGTAYTLTAGTHNDARIRLASGNNDVVITGNANVIFEYLEKKL